MDPIQRHLVLIALMHHRRTREMAHDGHTTVMDEVQTHFGVARQFAAYRYTNVQI